MKLRNIFKLGNFIITLALTCVWILLREDFTIITIVLGLIFSIITLIFCNMALPVGKVRNIKAHKLVMYPFFLIGQVYLAGFHVIKLIFTGATAEIVQVKTNIENESLRILLVDSVTLTPGSVLIKLEGDEFTLLWLKGKGDELLTPEQRDDAIKGKLERWLITAQKQPKL